MNGWQTAYGYDDGRSRDVFVRVGRATRRSCSRAAAARAHRAARAALLRELGEAYDAFMALDEDAWRALQAGDPAETKRILLGPELEHFETMARAAERARRRAAAAGRGGAARSSTTPATTPAASSSRSRSAPAS